MKQHRAPRQRADRAFTLIELLVVIVVIGVLVSLVMVGLQSARASARRTHCSSNLRQLALAAQAYHTDWQTFPPGLKQTRAAEQPRYRGTSLFTYLLPHLEQGNIVGSWDYDDPMKNTVGGASALSAVAVEVFVCPSDAITINPVAVGDRFYGLTSYGGNGGTRSSLPDNATTDGIFLTTGPSSQPQSNHHPVSISQIKDGAGHTILFGERSHADPNFASFVRLGWAESLDVLGRWPAIGGRKRIADVTLSGIAPLNYRLPFDYSHRAAAVPALSSSRDFEHYDQLRKCAFGSEHSGGAGFAMADGSVKFLVDTISPEHLVALCTRAGHENVTP